MINSKPVKYMQLPKADRLPDSKNSTFLFQGIDTSILKLIVSGEINAKEYAQIEMINRGLDKNGNCIGFSGTNKQKLQATFHDIFDQVS